MIQLSKNYSLLERQEEPIPIKVVGVGSAGSNALDRVLLDGMDKDDLIAVNTDVQSLASSVAARKVQLGRSSTHGLGTGGDPELGYQAAIESADEIRQAIAGARMIFICAGLGGGTGSGAGPIVAQLAREAGSLVIAFATLPFSFEGKRRAAQAQDALSRLNEIANAVICFENDRMGDMVAPKAGIHQAFGIADMTISQSVRSIVNLIQRPGLIRIGFDDSIAAQETSPPPEPFLAPPPAILEQVEEPPPAPPTIDIVPETESAASLEPAPDDWIAVEPPVAAEAPPPPVPAPSIKKPAPRLIPPKKKPVVEKEAKPPKEKSVQAKQEVLQFEPVTRGRFEKSEPTIVEGQDLDIPTFLRKNIRVK